MSGNGGNNKPYTNKEKVLLAHLVKDNGMVECKKTDGTTVAEKKAAWDIISINYNSQPDVEAPRTPLQLKKLWANLKQRKRKETTALRHSMLLTGGGPPKKPMLDPVLLMVEDAAPGMDVSIVCPWDSSAMFEEQVRVSSPEEAVVVVADCSNRLNTSRLASPLPSTSFVDVPFFSDISETAAEHKSSQKKKSVAVSINTEKDARVKRAADAVKQQEELHELRKEIANEELLRAKEENLRVRQERKNVELQEEAIRWDVKRRKDEAELAALKLEQFRRTMLAEQFLE